VGKVGRHTGATHLGSPIERVTRIVGDVHVLGPDADLTVAGDGSFGGSPLVPNPAALNPAAAASIGELEARIAESSAGFVRSMGPKSFLVPFLDNTTTEQSMLNAGFAMPRINFQAVYRLVAFGVLRNVSGGSVNFTWRVRNTTDATIVCPTVVAVPNDTQARPWRFEATGEGTVFLDAAVASIGHALVGAGASAALQQAMGSAGIDDGTDPQNWDVTAQASVAHADVEMTVYGVQILYALAGA
jgi:hypothetical protein